jgi:hypothetical protein
MEVWLDIANEFRVQAMFYLALAALVIVPVIFSLFVGVAVQYTFRLIRRKFSERRP